MSNINSSSINCSSSTGTTANLNIPNTLNFYTPSNTTATLSYVDDVSTIYNKYYNTEILIEKLFSYLSEKEVDELFEKLMERDESVLDNKDKSSFIVRSKSDTEIIVEEYVQHNHCSEDFLIKYYNKKIISKSDIYQNHRRYIVSGEYPNLALLFEVEEK